MKSQIEQIERIIADLTLTTCGVLISWGFFVIYTKGNFYYIPESRTLFIIETLAAATIISLSYIYSIREARRAGKIFSRNVLVGACLMALSGVFFIQFAFAWIFGSSYSGHEPNTAILITELTIFVLLSLVGLTNAIIDIRKMIKKRELPDQN